MLILLLLIHTNSTVPTNSAANDDKNMSNTTTVDDSILNLAIEEIISSTNPLTKTAFKIKFSYNKKYKLSKIYFSKTTQIFRIVSDGKINVIKYVPKPIKISNKSTLLSEINHPNIVDVYKTVSKGPNDGYFMLMEPMECSLSLEYAIQYPLEIIEIIRSIANALKYLHERGIVYNNIRMENILVKTINNKKVYKLCDFSCSKGIDCQDEDLNHLSDPDYYTAPETLLELKYSEMTDIWMLGRLIKFYNDKTIPKIDTKRSDWSPSAEYYRLILQLRDKQERNEYRSKDADIVESCCMFEENKRIKIDGILEWCDQYI